MNPLSILSSYFLWHYTIAFRDIFRVWTNLLWFIFNYFSISELARTLFQPWKRLRGEYPKYFNPQEWIATFVTNMFMRLVGFIIRSITIIIGFVFVAVVFFAGLVVFVFWPIAPCIAIILIAVGAVMVF
jgi:hypothetical protein